MTVTDLQLKSLTEHAVEARLDHAEMAARSPGTSACAESRGRASAWHHALILMGGTMPDLDGGAA